MHKWPKKCHCCIIMLLTLALLFLIYCINSILALLIYINLIQSSFTAYRKNNIDIKLRLQNKCSKNNQEETCSAWGRANRQTLHIAHTVPIRNDVCNLPETPKFKFY